MKILGIVGSHKRNGNSFQMVKIAMEAVKEIEPLIETDIIQLADMRIESCRVCQSCRKTNLRCIIEEDDLQMIYERMRSADGIMFSSPLYFPIPSKMVALMERVVSLHWSKMEEDKNFISPLAGKPACLFSTSAGAPVNLVLFHLIEFVTFLQMRLLTMKEWPCYGVAPCAGWVDPLESAKKMGIIFAQALKEN